MQQLTALNCFQKSIIAYMEQVKLFNVKLSNMKSTCSISLKTSGVMHVTMKNIHLNVHCKRLNTKTLCFMQQLVALFILEKPGPGRKH